MSKIINKKSIFLLLFAILIISFFVFDFGQYLTLEFLKQQRSSFLAYYQAHQVLTIAIYITIYIAITSLSLPGALIMTLAGGAIFGVVVGSIAVSFASTIGATLAFLVARYILRESVQKRFGDRLKAINEGVEKEGVFYLFTLRLIPLFPFFVINLLMGITPIRTWHFFIVSQLGMLPGTIVYVNAGDQIASIESASGIVSPGLIASLALLGILPIVAKKIVDYVKLKRINKDQ